MKQIKKIETLEGKTTHGDVKSQINQAIFDINENFASSGANLTGYTSITSESDLPSNPSVSEKTLGYLLGTDLYVYVGTGGNAAGGKYKNCGPFKGPKGEQGNSGYTGAAGELEIVNNLTQGGAAAALSAEQGKIINKLITIFEKPDGLEITNGVYSSFDKSKVNYSYDISRCCVVNVNPGEIFKLTCSAINVDYCGAFVTSINGDVVQKYFSDNKTAYYDELITIPEGGSQLYVNGYHDPLDLSLFAVEKAKPMSAVVSKVPTIAEESERLSKEISLSEEIERAEESALREKMYESELKNPFVWKPFSTAYFTWTNDDGLQSMVDYMTTCEKYGIPYCPAFPPEFIDHIYNINNPDTRQRLIVSEPHLNDRIAITVGSSYNKVHLYADIRSNMIGKSITAELTLHTNGGTSKKTLLFADIKAGNNYQDCAISTSVNKLDFEIISMGGEDRSDKIAFYVTPYSSGMLTLSAPNLLKRIVNNFGEILAHGTHVISSFDKEVAESQFRYYCYEGRAILEKATGKPVYGLITPGGPNSNRWFNTILGQKYMVRNYLYGDYYGNTPQYNIKRDGPSALCWICQLKVPAGLIHLDNYTINGIGSTVLEVLNSGEMDIVYAKVLNQNGISAIGDITDYDTGEFICNYTNGQFAEGSKRKELFLQLFNKELDRYIREKNFMAWFAHEEVPIELFDAMIGAVVAKKSQIKIGTWKDVYDENRSSKLEML